MPRLRNQFAIRGISLRSSAANSSGLVANSSNAALLEAGAQGRITQRTHGLVHLP
jgi:hypothetical protein